MDFLLSKVSADDIEYFTKRYTEDKGSANQYVSNVVIQIAEQLASGQIDEIEYTYKMSVFFRMMTQVISNTNKPQYLNWIKYIIHIKAIELSVVFCF